MKYFLLMAFLFFNSFIAAQDKNLSKDIAAIVFLDSFVVTASQQGFDVADFIDIVQKDESFFLAFHNLRLQDYYSDNQVEIYDKKKEIKATYKNRIHQKVVDRCRTMDILEETITGNFFKNKRKRAHRYYTARMHESVFFTKGKICETRDRPEISEQKLSGLSKHINELKKLIFQPGREVEIPLIGGKTAIFKEDMLKFYNFSIASDTCKDSTACYVFKAVAKPKYRKGKTIIKYLETFFDATTFQVLGRNYHLQYEGVVRFDVKMKVELQQVTEGYIPNFIEYNGVWKVPLKKEEQVRFIISIEYKD